MLTGKRIASSASRASRWVILSIALACVMLASTPMAEAKVAVTPLARFTPGDQFGPDIEGTRVVYTDNAAGNNNIYLYSLQTKVRQRLTYGIDDESRPRISGDNIVYLRSKNGVSQLKCYTISTGRSRNLTSGVTSVIEHAVSGDTVAFVGTTAAPYTYVVRTVSLSTGLTKTIDSHTGHAPYSLSIAGDHLAYSVYPDLDEDDDSGRMNLCVADLAAETTGVVGSGDGACITASGTVVFSQSWGDLDPMFLKSYDAITKATSTVSTGWAQPLSISAGRLLFYDRQGLWVGSLSAGTRVKIASPKAIYSFGTARMSGTRVVWDDTRHTAKSGYIWPPGTPGNWMNYDVYSATYSSPMMAVACPKGVTYGKHATVTGKVSTISGAPYTGRVTLQRSTDTKHWRSDTAKSTSAVGRFSLTSGSVRGRTYFRARFVRGNASAVSAYITVMPRAIVSKPNIPSQVSTSNAAVAISGTVRPAQSKWSDLGVVGGFKRADGTWERFDFSYKVYTPVAHGSYSTYKVKLLGLLRSGHWRVRVYAGDSTRGIDWGVSPYAYFTVK